MAERIVRANVDRRVEISPTFVSLYVNDTQIEVTPWDFRFTFGEITRAPTADNPTVGVKSTGEIRMSPQHAKKLAEILVQTLQRYESAIGKIPLPQD